MWPCVLITRRSQVQILPPLPTSSQVRGPLTDVRGPLALAMCNQVCSQNRQGIAWKSRSGGAHGDD